MAIDERDLDDSALVQAAQHGDHDAFAELFRRHYPTVRRVCARRFGSISEADEVAQAAFVRAFERLHQCEGERRFGAWVQVIAYNLGADARRASARSTIVDEPAMADAVLGPNHCEDHVLRAERVAEVRELLDRLPPRQREVIIARDLEGRRPGEIAASLGLSLGAVDSLLLRARRRMAVVWSSTVPEQGAATFPATATLAATTAAVVPGPISRALVAVGNAVASASYRIATSIGIVPGSSMPTRVGSAVGTVVVAGALATVPMSMVHTPPASVDPEVPVRVAPVAVPPAPRTVVVVPAVPPTPPVRVGHVGVPTVTHSPVPTSHVAPHAPTPDALRTAVIAVVRQLMRTAGLAR
ncbi:MAG: RNA polymerase sigma factor [Acidimicrobiales bacterium]